MKKVVALVLVGFFISFVGSAFSEQGQKETLSQAMNQMQEKSMEMQMGKECPSKDKSGRPPMMPMMAQNLMVSAGDGGVIILTGNKLMKYDKDLNLVKEVEIKMDKGFMEKMMGRHRVIELMDHPQKAQEKAKQPTQEKTAQ